MIMDRKHGKGYMIMKKRVLFRGAMAACLALCLFLALAGTALALSPAPETPPDPAPVQPVEIYQCVAGGGYSSGLRVDDGDVVITVMEYTNYGTEPWSGSLHLCDPALSGYESVSVIGAEVHGSRAGIYVEGLPAGGTYRIVVTAVVPEGGPGATDWCVTGYAYPEGGGVTAYTVERCYGTADLKASARIDGDDVVVLLDNSGILATGSASRVCIRVRLDGLDDAGKAAVADLDGRLDGDGLYAFPAGAVTKGGRSEYVLEGLAKYADLSDLHVDHTYGCIRGPRVPAYVIPEPVE